MPQNVSVAAFIFGVVFFLAAIVGKEIEIAAIKIPALGNPTRIILAILGGALIYIGLLNPFDHSASSISGVPTPPAAVPATVSPFPRDSTATNTSAVARTIPTVVATTLILPADTPESNGVLFYDDFQQFPTKWMKDSGDWTATPDGIQVQKGDTFKDGTYIDEVGRIFAKGHFRDNYSVRIRVNNIYVGNVYKEQINFLVGWTGSSYAFFRLSSSDWQHGCGTTKEGSNKPLDQVRNDISDAIVKIDVSGNNYKYSINDDVICEFNDSSISGDIIGIEIIRSAEQNVDLPPSSVTIKSVEVTRLP